METGEDARTGARGPGPEEFARRAEEPPSGLLREFLGFLRENKRWWLAPILAVIFLLGLFVILMGSGAAPFLYTLF